MRHGRGQLLDALKLQRQLAMIGWRLWHFSWLLDARTNVRLADIHGIRLSLPLNQLNLAILRLALIATIARRTVFGRRGKGARAIASMTPSLLVFVGHIGADENAGADGAIGFRLAIAIQLRIEHTFHGTLRNGEDE